MTCDIDIMKYINLPMRFIVNYYMLQIPVHINFTEFSSKVVIYGFNDDVTKAVSLLESLIESNSIQHFQFNNSRWLSKFVSLDGRNIKAVAKRYPEVSSLLLNRQSKMSLA